MTKFSAYLPILSCCLIISNTRAFGAEELKKTADVNVNSGTAATQKTIDSIKTLSENDALKLKAVQANASQRKALSLDFDQVFVSGVTKAVRKSQGTLDYLAPSFFRWEVVNPRKEIYVNGPKEFLSYTEATKHAQKMPPGSFELDFVDLALHLSSLEKKYKVSSSKALDLDANEFCIELNPIKDDLQQSIFLVLSEKASYVTKMKIVYANGNTTKINFKNPKFIAKSQSRFEYTPPKGTAIDKL